MPFIKRLPNQKKRWDNKRKRNRTDKEKLRVKLYNNSKWKKLRLGYLISHPLCEKCLENDKVTSATDVHHINSPFDEGLTEEERLGRLCDPNNLMALCKECHGKLHFNQDKNNNRNK